MGNDLTVSGQGAFGGLQPSGTIGAEEFAAHDPITSWQDQGESEALANQVADDLVAMFAAHGADQVKKAIIDWFSNAVAELDEVEEQQVILIDASADGAQFGTFYRLFLLFSQAHAQAFTAGTVRVQQLTLKTVADVVKDLIQQAEAHGNNQVLQMVGATLADLQSSFRGPAPAAATPDPRAVRGRNGTRQLTQGQVRGTPVQRGPHASTGTGRQPATTQQRRSPDPQIAGAEPHRQSRRNRSLAPAPQADE